MLSLLVLTIHAHHYFLFLQYTHNPLQYSCWKKYHRPRSLAGYSPWGFRESDRAEHTCIIYTTEFRYLFCSLVLFATSCFMTLETFHGLGQFFLLDLMLFFFNWRMIALQCCLGFCQTSAWISQRYVYVSSLVNLPPSLSSPSRLWQSAELSSLHHTTNSHWLFYIW